MIPVSEGSLERAFRIMAGLISAIEGRGFAVSIEAVRQEKRDQTVAKIRTDHQVRADGEG